MFDSSFKVHVSKLTKLHVAAYETWQLCQISSKIMITRNWVTNQTFMSFHELHVRSTYIYNQLKHHVTAHFECIKTTASSQKIFQLFIRRKEREKQREGERKEKQRERERERERESWVCAGCDADASALQMCLCQLFHESPSSVVGQFPFTNHHHQFCGEK